MSIVKANKGSLPSTNTNSMFADFLNRELFNWSNNNFSTPQTTLPAVNIRENQEQFLIELAAPGMKKEDFKISLEKNLLIISSTKQDQTEEQTGHYTRREFSYQSFIRRFDLASEVLDEDRIEAKYESGILKLIIPKRIDSAQNAMRIIQIQ